MVAACSLRYHVRSCKWLFHVLPYRSCTVGCLKRHFFYCENTFSIEAESRKPGHDFKIVVQTLSRSHILLHKSTSSLSWGCLMFSFCLLASFCSMSWCERGKYLGKKLSTSLLLLHFSRSLGRCCHEVELGDILLSFRVAVFRVCLGSPGQKQSVFKMLALLFRYWQFIK